MNRARQIALIRTRYVDWNKPNDNDKVWLNQLFTRGEVGILLDEITHLTLLLADLHAKANAAEKPWEGA